MRRTSKCCATSIPKTSGPGEISLPASVTKAVEASAETATLHSRQRAGWRTAEGSRLGTGIRVRLRSGSAAAERVPSDAEILGDLRASDTVTPVTDMATAKKMARRRLGIEMFCPFRTTDQ